VKVRLKTLICIQFLLNLQHHNLKNAYHRVRQLKELLQAVASICGVFRPENNRRSSK